MKAKTHEYRDLLELWSDWWNGPGRRDYTGNVLPPLKRTSDALYCMGCHGIKAEPDEEEDRCRACGRRM